MGYTHYWRLTKAPDPLAWVEAVKDCEKLVAESKVPLVPECNDDWTLGFNGVDDDAHETFTVPRSARKIQFECCKTARKPYDTVVVACLCRLAEVGLKVSSDGDPEDWVEGQCYAHTVLGRAVTIPATVGGE